MLKSSRLDDYMLQSNRIWDFNIGRCGLEKAPKARSHMKSLWCPRFTTCLRRTKPWGRPLHKINDGHYMNFLEQWKTQVNMET